MTQIDVFDAYGERFRFEPPVEVGEHVVDSLGRLAAIAAVGYGDSPDKIAALASSIDHSLATIHRFTGTKKFPETLAELISIKGASHTVTVE